MFSSQNSYQHLTVVQPPPCVPVTNLPVSNPLESLLSVDLPPDNFNSRSGGHNRNKWKRRNNFSNNKNNVYKPATIGDKSNKFNCETCDRSFNNQLQFDQHNSEHRTCGVEGCTFTAHPKIVDNHINMQHLTGLYKRMVKTEDPNEIQKYINERRRKYPSKNNMIMKEKAENEKYQRGERISSYNGRFAKPERKPMHLNEYMNNASSSSNNCTLVASENGAPMNLNENMNSANSSTNNCTSVVSKNGALMNLMSNYCDSSSGDESDGPPIEEKIQKSSTMIDEPVTNENINCDTSNRADDDDEPPSKIIKLNNTSNDIQLETIGNDKLKSPDKNVNAEVVSPNKKQSPSSVQHNTRSENKHNSPMNQSKRTQPTIREQYLRQNRPPTLLEKLLEPEIRHERNVILQCIRYVVQNNFFQK